MNTLEYVPVMMPTTIVNAKPCSTSPPKKNSARAVSSAVPDVMTVRPSVWLIDTLMTWFSESRRMPRRFSRIRSKMTIVSLVEYPVIVRMAATTFSDMSYRKNARNAIVMSRSWTVATTAPTPKLNWKRNARYRRMPTSESTVADSPLVRSSFPTAGPTISVPDSLKAPTLPFFSASTTCCLVELREPPDSAPTCGTRIITCRCAGSPKVWTTTFWPPPGNDLSSAWRTCCTLTG